MLQPTCNLVASWLQVYLQVSAILWSGWTSKPSCGARIATEISSILITKFPEQHLDLTSIMSRKNLLQFSEGCSFYSLLSHMLQQQFLVGITIQSDDPRVNAGFTNGTIQATGKDIFTPTDMLHDPHFCQVLQSILHMTV